MSVQLSPIAVQRFYDNNNNPLVGGQLFTYQAGTTTPVATYTDSTGLTANTNPVILNARGEAPVWLTATQSYKLVLEDAAGNTIWTVDNVTAPAPVAVGNMTDEKGAGGSPGFAANTDFIPGTTTTLTLSKNYGSAANLWVSFDAAEQGADSYSLSGTTLTFNSPIPVGISKVFVKGGTALTIGTPGAGAVTDASVATGSALYNRINHVFDVTDPQFGAVGDGVTDDAAAINLALQAAANVGGEVLFPATKTFLIKSPLICTTSVSLNPVIGTNYELYFSDMRTVTVRSPGRCTIKAGASMTTMLTFIFSGGNIAPYFCKVDGLVFDGNNLATNGLLYNYATKAHACRNSFVNMNGGFGLSNLGYGTGEYLYNTIATKIGIQVNQGGDVTIEHNDIYAPMNSVGHIGIEMQGWSGNTHIHKNTFTADATSSAEVPINLDANIPSQSGKEIRDVTIRDNEFCGYDLPISGVAGSNNMYNCIISGNHKTALGSKVSAALVSLTGPGQFIISDNIIGNAAYPTLTGNVFSFANASRLAISGNKFTNLNDTPIVFSNVVQSKVFDNEFYDVGKGSILNAVIYLGSTCAGNEFYRNTYNQSSGSYAQTGIAEHVGCDYTFAREESFTGIATPYLIVGAHSVMRQVGWGSAAPSSGAYNVGDTVYNTGLSNSAGIPVGFVCVAAGTPGTWRGFGVTV